MIGGPSQVDPNRYDAPMSDLQGGEHPAADGFGRGDVSDDEDGFGSKLPKQPMYWISGAIALLIGLGLGW